MKQFIFYITCMYSLAIYGQGNCLVFPEDSGERKACELCHDGSKYSQGSKESQLVFDQAIAIGPKYAWAYYQKSVPYFKRGFPTEGLRHLKKAVALEPLNYLCYQAYWFWQYKNYELCIRDLEQFYKLQNAYDEHTPGGEKSMKVILSLAYAKTDNLEKGIEILENYIDTHAPLDDLGYSDYYTLGFLYVQNKEYNKAIAVLERQLITIKKFAEAHYFLGMAQKHLSNTEEALAQFNKALLIFNDANRYQNINAGFPVSISDIEKEIENLR